jgi:hypothetical protein
MEPQRSGAAIYQQGCEKNNSTAIGLFEISAYMLIHAITLNAREAGLDLPSLNHW